MKKFHPKKGEKVYLYYDGKQGRKTEGEVLISRGFALKVRFKLFTENTIVENWFIRIDDNAYGGYVRQVKDSVMKGLLGLKGDWYVVRGKNV